MQAKLVAEDLRDVKAAGGISCQGIRAVYFYVECTFSLSDELSHLANIVYLEMNGVDPIVEIGGKMN
jgi:hypothetical protein